MYDHPRNVWTKRVAYALYVPVCVGLGLAVGVAYLDRLAVQLAERIAQRKRLAEQLADRESVADSPDASGAG